MLDAAAWILSRTSSSMGREVNALDDLRASMSRMSLRAGSIAPLITIPW
jgi:hypothetical protein